jgi:nucleoside-diphosphate-sugar epimerase
MTDAAMSLDGKRVIVIGGASGIGFAVAALSRELCVEVVIASSNGVNVEAAVERLSGTTGNTVDLRDEASVSRFFDYLGAFDHLSCGRVEPQSIRPTRFIFRHLQHLQPAIQSERPLLDRRLSAPRDGHCVLQ